jgi:hypothetical protein
MPGVECIMLTDSQKDPKLKTTNYALRSKTFHPTNKDEVRILEGKILSTHYEMFPLVTSTSEPHGKLGLSFHLFLPENVIYGYPWTRNGEIKIAPGIKINVRSFEKKFADYTGEFNDQWIMLKLSINKEAYLPDLIEKFTEIASSTEGKTILSSDYDNYKKLFDEVIPDNVPASSDADVVFIIDATNSMQEEIPVFQGEYPYIKDKLLKKIKNLRIGLIFYRDYGDDFLVRKYDLTDDLKVIDYLITQIKIAGGGDIPEAVYEAISELKTFDFKSGNRIAFLAGDAPPHPVPRGKITRADALNVLKNYKIKLNSICFTYK